MEAPSLFPESRSNATRARPFAALAALTAINLLNYADRYVLSGVQELLKRDTSFVGGPRDAAGLLTDTSLGVLATAFMVVYMLVSPFTGYLGDRVRRKYLISTSVLLWSLATMASGLAPDYPSLLVARACIGIGEAGYAAVSPSILSDLFSQDRRGKAIGVFYAAIPLGAAMGFTVGGSVGAAMGWRSAFFVAGLPGLALALVALLLPEPKRGQSDRAELRGSPLGPLATLRSLVRNREFLVATAGMTLMTFSVGGLANWMPSFLARFTGLSPGQAGTSMGALTAVAGLSATLIGTWLGEIAVRRHRGGYLLVSGAGLVAAVPFVLLAAAHPGPSLTLAAVFAALFLALLNTGPLNTAVVNAVPASMRSSAVALSILAIHLFGDALSPTAVGRLSDACGSLAVALAANGAPLLLGGALLLMGASGWFSKRTELPDADRSRPQAVR
jgi:predicted MFS family arabinose efflux permease